MADYFILDRSLKLLENYHDEQVRIPVLMAQNLLSEKRYVELFTMLAGAGDTFNPHKRRKDSQYRQKCLDDANKKIHRCMVAQVFYELSEAMYRQSNLAFIVSKSKKKVQLT